MIIMVFETWHINLTLQIIIPYFKISDHIFSVFHNQNSEHVYSTQCPGDGKETFGISESMSQYEKQFLHQECDFLLFLFEGE